MKFVILQSNQIQQLNKMSTVRITYFNIRGVAELTRLLFVYSEHDFEDERLEREAWPARKPESPLGSVPYIRLENGHEYPQATSIARYFADKFGLRGKTDEEKLHADVVVDLVRADIIPMLTKIFLEQDAEKKEAGKKEAQEKIQAWFEKIETKFIKGESTILGKL